MGSWYRWGTIGEFSGIFFLFYAPILLVFVRVKQTMNLRKYTHLCFFLENEKVLELHHKIVNLFFFPPILYGPKLLLLLVLCLMLRTYVLH